MDDAVLQIDVLPLQAQQFPPAQARGQVQVVQLVHTALLRLPQEGAQPLRGKCFHLPVLDLRQLAALGGIAEN